MLRDRKKLLDSLRAYRDGEIPAVAGEEERHFIESIERRLKAVNADLRGLEAAARTKERGAVPSSTAPAPKHSTNQAI
jgi:hypothetical protein